MGGSGHKRHLHSVAVGNQRRPVGACGVHHRDDVLHPILGCTRLLDDAVGETDAAHVKPEDASVAIQRTYELLDERLLPDGLEVAGPVEYENNVARTVADRLIGEVHVAALRIERPRRWHLAVRITATADAVRS